MKKIILPVLFFMLLSSCNDEAEIAIQNKVHNATLTEISWDGHLIGRSLLPGQTSETYKVYEDPNYKLPREAVVKFYMNRDGNQVYLETKHAYLLKADDNLLIVISDTTQVVNPALP